MVRLYDSYSRDTYTGVERACNAMTHTNKNAHAHNICVPSGLTISIMSCSVKDIRLLHSLGLAGLAATYINIMTQLQI